MTELSRCVFELTLFLDRTCQIAVFIAARPGPFMYLEGSLVARKRPKRAFCALLKNLDIIIFY